MHKHPKSTAQKNFVKTKMLHMHPIRVDRIDHDTNNVKNHAFVEATLHPKSKCVDSLEPVSIDSEVKPLQVCRIDRA